MIPVLSCQMVKGKVQSTFIAPFALLLLNLVPGFGKMILRIQVMVLYVEGLKFQWYMNVISWEIIVCLTFRLNKLDFPSHLISLDITTNLMICCMYAMYHSQFCIRDAYNICSGFLTHFLFIFTGCSFVDHCPVVWILF